MPPSRMSMKDTSTADQPGALYKAQAEGETR